MTLYSMLYSHKIFQVIMKTSNTYKSKVYSEPHIPSSRFNSFSDRTTFVSFRNLIVFKREDPWIEQKFPPLFCILLLGEKKGEESKRRYLWFWPRGGWVRASTWRAVTILGWPAISVHSLLAQRDTSVICFTDVVFTLPHGGPGGLLSWSLWSLVGDASRRLGGQRGEEPTVLCLSSS